MGKRRGPLPNAHVARDISTGSVPRTAAMRGTSRATRSCFLEIGLRRELVHFRPANAGSRHVATCRARSASFSGRNRSLDRPESPSRVSVKRSDDAIAGATSPLTLTRTCILAGNTPLSQRREDSGRSSRFGISGRATGSAVDRGFIVAQIRLVSSRGAASARCRARRSRQPGQRQR